VLGVFDDDVDDLWDVIAEVAAARQAADPLPRVTALVGGALLSVFGTWCGVVLWWFEQVARCRRRCPPFE
jgi:hypothetical protein